MKVYCSRCNEVELSVPDNTHEDVLVDILCIECMILEQENKDFENERSIRNEEVAQYLFPDPDIDSRTRSGDYIKVDSLEDIP